MRQLLLSFVAGLALAAPALAEDLLPPAGGYALGSDLSQLPEAVREKRDALLAAAAAGDFDAVAAILNDQPGGPPNTSFGAPDDPVEYLRTAGEGGEPEILAILANVLSANFAALDGGDGSVLYVWPSLAVMDDITEVPPAQEVEGIRLIGTERFRDMQSLGYWLDWRLFMSSTGDVQAFVAGD